MKAISFRHPEPPGRKHRIWPVFLPFQGCRSRCIYCAQPLQSGTQTRRLQEHFEALQADLDRAARCSIRPLELGFYGGSFTGLPAAWVHRFLELVRHYRESGMISRIRCSTRPDMLSSLDLRSYKQAGLDMVELGVQSFSDEVLQGSGRGYSAADAMQGIELVRQAGLELGIQLLPGLPGQTRGQWLRDVDLTAAAAPEAVRLYPCLVLEGTPLARLWRQGGYLPWSLDETVPALARGLGRLWRHGVRVIRIGLPPQADLTGSILAGPWHPALGSLVRGRVLRARLQAACLLLGPGEKRLVCPEGSQGEIWGHQGSNRPGLTALGLSPEAVRFEGEGVFRLEKV